MVSEINDKAHFCKAPSKLSALLERSVRGRTLASMTRPPAKLLTVLLFVVACAAGAPSQASSEAASADGFLEFQSEADGRCQILSEGGKLRVLYNRHASRAIDYRLMRMFGDGHRQGRVVGTAPAGGERVPLGCTRVDGHPQDWQLERATFSP